LRLEAVLTVAMAVPMLMIMAPVLVISFLTFLLRGVKIHA